MIFFLKPRRYPVPPPHLPLGLLDHWATEPLSQQHRWTLWTFGTLVGILGDLGDQNKKKIPIDGLEEESGSIFHARMDISKRLNMNMDVIVIFC